MFVTKCFSAAELTTPNLFAHLDESYRTLLSHASNITGAEFVKDFTPIIAPWGSDVILTGEGWWYRKHRLASPSGPVYVPSRWEEIPRDRDAITLLSSDLSVPTVDVWVEITNVPGEGYPQPKTSVATVLAMLSARRIRVQRHVGLAVSEMPVSETAEEFVLRMHLKDKCMTT